MTDPDLSHPTQTDPTGPAPVGPHLTSTDSVATNASQPALTDGPLVTVDVQYGLADFEQFQQLVERNVADASRRPILLGLLVGGVVTALLSWLILGWLSFDWIVGAGFIGFLASFTAILSVGILSGRAQQAARREYLATSPTRFRVEVWNDGVYAFKPTGRSHLYWRGVHAIDLTSDHVFLRDTTLSGIIIPHNNFIDRSERDRFVAWLAYFRPDAIRDHESS